MNSIILTGTIPCDGKVKSKMSQSADVWPTPLSRHHARVRGPEPDVQIGREACIDIKGPETDVQSLHSPSYATADVRLHFFAAK